MRFSANSMTLLLALAVAPTATQAVLSNDCKSDLADMYDMSSLTYQTIHDPSVMASMTHELVTPEGSVYYTFNGNQEALATFQEKCQGYNLSANATAISSTNSTNTNPYTTMDMTMSGGRVTRLSLMRSCTKDYNIGLPACVPTSCGTDDESDAEIATALSDLFAEEDCVSVYLPTRGSTGESITSACLADVVNTTSPAMTMAACEMNKNTTAIDVSFEHICGGNVKHVMDGIYCVPSSCESSEAVSELFKGQLVKITPYMDTMEMSNGTVNGTGTVGNETIGNETSGNETVPVAECEWVYKDPSFVLRNGTDVDTDADADADVDTNKTDTNTNLTVGDDTEDEEEDDCEEYPEMANSNKSSKSSSSKASSKAKKGKSTAATSAPLKTSSSKKTKSSCKKTAKGGSLRRTKAPKMPRPSIDSSELKIRSWNPLGLNRN